MTDIRVSKGSEEEQKSSVIRMVDQILRSEHADDFASHPLKHELCAKLSLLLAGWEPKFICAPKRCFSLALDLAASLGAFPLFTVPGQGEMVLEEGEELEIKSGDRVIVFTDFAEDGEEVCETVRAIQQAGGRVDLAVVLAYHELLKDVNFGDVPQLLCFLPLYKKSQENGTSF